MVVDNFDRMVWQMVRNMMYNVERLNPEWDSNSQGNVGQGKRMSSMQTL